jgi:hypothetical protein
MTILSRRNLLCLLARLELGEKRPMILKIDNTAVYAERDEDHYRDYSPAELDPAIANLVQAIDTLLKNRI